MAKKLTFDQIQIHSQQKIDWPIVQVFQSHERLRKNGKVVVHFSPKASPLETHFCQIIHTGFSVAQSKFSRAPFRIDAIGYYTMTIKDFDKLLKLSVWVNPFYATALK